MFTHFGSGGGRNIRLREREWGGPNSDEGTDTVVLKVNIYCTRTLWVKWSAEHMEHDNQSTSRNVMPPSRFVEHFSKKLFELESSLF